MKLFIPLLVITLMSCSASNRNYDSLPQCIKDQIDNPAISIVKVGKSEAFSEGKTLYWVFEEDKYFGNVVGENCESSRCYGWCGLTTKEEVDDIFDQDWTLLWRP